MSKPHILILSEQPPLAESEPATGLAVRHTLMARELAGQGREVTFAWPASGGDTPPPAELSFESLALAAPSELADWLERNAPAALVLGYWELAEWLPAGLESALVLDYIAPRLLERQFEDRERLGEDASKLIEVLARCDRVWVGNERQRDLMLPWMLLAGHDCRFGLAVDVVPIAGYLAEQPADRVDGPGRDVEPERPLTLYHGGRDWPWRDSSAWLMALRKHSGPWRIDDGGEAQGLLGYAAYRKRLRAADLALELCDDNIERRYSHSFRMTDALCSGVPLICNHFLPIAGLIARHQAGWIVDSPDKLPALLRAIAADRNELARRAANARRLARDRFDATRVYAGLGEKLAGLAEKSRPALPAKPLLQAHRGPTRPESETGLLTALRAYLALSLHRRVRQPFHRLLQRRMADRPQPDAQRSCWLVLSRPDVFPTDHGAAVKIERTAWGLSFHVEVILLTDRRSGYWVYRRGEREYRRFPWWPRLAGGPRAIGLIRLMARGVPLSNAFLYRPWVERGMHYRVAWLMRRHPVEVVQGEFPAYAHPAVWAARLFGTRSLMVEHNVEFQRIAEQVPDLSESGRRTLRKLEVDLANACDRVITVSNRDRRDLVAAGVRETLVTTIPHGVDLERFADAEPVELRTRYDIPADHAVLAYHGIYSYGPNLEAVEELAHVLLPKLQRRGVPATVVALGPQPPEKSLPGVVFAGSVADLPGHLKGADLAVIPLRQGGGTRMKILDDFAAGVPVIATSKGAEGIPVAHNQHLLIVDDPEEMAEAVIDLLENDRERTRLAANARRWVAEFDWRKIARRYVETMRGQS